MNSIDSIIAVAAVENRTAPVVIAVEQISASSAVDFGAIITRTVAERVIACAAVNRDVIVIVAVKIIGAVAQIYHGIIAVVILDGIRAVAGINFNAAAAVVN